MYIVLYPSYDLSYKAYEYIKKLCLQMYSNAIAIWISILLLRHPVYYWNDVKFVKQLWKKKQSNK